LSRLIDLEDLDSKERYQLLTSLVVPRPIGWVSTRSASGTLNLAPFSFFGAISAAPMFLSLSIGRRRGQVKDSLRNIREQGVFCVNVVTEPQLEQMNLTAGDYGPEIDEFERAGLPVGEGQQVQAPYVANFPAVFQCRLHREVELAREVSLVIAEALAVHLAAGLECVEGTRFVDSERLRPVGRLWGSAYGLLGELRRVKRPRD